MEIIKSEKKLCLTCMEEHEIQTVILKDKEEFKGKEVSFNATYEYCERADEYLETENMIKANSLAMKDSYRKKSDLLTSDEIIAIRDKYKVSQKDFSDILDWGRATITRYENHQVQDRAHDDVLKKIDSDPKWFIKMLNRAKAKLSEKAFIKYEEEAKKQFRKTCNRYLMDSIQALYADYVDDSITGGVKLNLIKVVEMINYYAANVINLHKVKLMKMLWYADNLSYKRTGKSISGLVYVSLSIGVVPVGYEQIINVEGVEFEATLYDTDCMSYKFHPKKGFEIKKLSLEEIEVLDLVIAKVGHLNSLQIIEKMHDEDAFKSTNQNCIIPFSFAKKTFNLLK